MLMPALFISIGVTVVAVAAVLATGRLGELSEVSPERPPLVLADGSLRSEDLSKLRFGVGLRGYRMAEVDLVLDRLIAELAEREHQPDQRERQPDEREHQPDEREHQPE